MTEARNPYAPPRASLEHRGREGYWREGKILVAYRGSDLPRRCVKCNEAVHEPTKTRNVYWHHPTIYLVLLLNVILYVLVAAIARKKAPVAPGLCHAHKKRRRLGILGGWIGFLLGLAVALGSGGQNNFLGAALGILLALASIIASMIVSRVVYPQKIDQDYVRLKGCGDDFLDSLPEHAS